MKSDSEKRFVEAIAFHEEQLKKVKEVKGEEREEMQTAMKHMADKCASGEPTKNYPSEPV